jgi:hypothetical protein
VSDERRIAPHPANRGLRVARAPATPARKPEVDSTDQLQPGLGRVEVEAAVAPANTTSTRSLFPRSPLVLRHGAGIRPGWALADIPIGMQMDAHRLLRDLYPGLLA